MMFQEHDNFVRGLMKDLAVDPTSAHYFIQSMGPMMFLATSKGFLAGDELAEVIKLISNGKMQGQVDAARLLINLWEREMQHDGSIHADLAEFLGKPYRSEDIVDAYMIMLAVMDGGLGLLREKLVRKIQDDAQWGEWLKLAAIGRSFEKAEMDRARSEQ